jgi:hypothetical protein
MEDRIFSYKPVIENANKYITRIDVFINPQQSKKDVAVKNNNTEYMNRIEKEIDADKYQAMSIYILGKRNRIPVHVYTNLNDFNFMTENDINTEMQERYENDYKMIQEPNNSDKVLNKSWDEIRNRTTKLNIIAALMNICFDTNTIKYVNGTIPQNIIQQIALILKRFNLQGYTAQVINELKKSRDNFNELCHLLSSTVNLPIRKLNTEIGDDESNNIMMLAAYVLKKYNCTNFDTLARQKP